MVFFEFLWIFLYYGKCWVAGRVFWEVAFETIWMEEVFRGSVFGNDIGRERRV